jgi:hypothetical protein
MRRKEMFKRFGLLALLACFVVSITGVAWSQEVPKQLPLSQPAPHGGLQGKQFVGEIVKVDVKNKKLVAKDATGEKQFDMSKATLGGYGSLADVKPGEKVAVLYEEKGKKLTAKVVMNHSSMTKPARAPAK